MKNDGNFTIGYIFGFWSGFLVMLAIIMAIASLK